MKRILSLLLAAALLLWAAFVLAEPQPSDAVITIDGVRTAFFDEAGGNLTPIEVDGILYVPLASFCENAGLPIEVKGSEYRITIPSDAAPEAENPDSTQAFKDLLTSGKWIIRDTKKESIVFEPDGTCIYEYPRGKRTQTLTGSWSVMNDRQVSVVVYLTFIMDAEELNGKTILRIHDGKDSDPYFYLENNEPWRVSDGACIRITSQTSVNVRAYPDQKSRKVGMATSGQVYELLDIADNGWYKIRLDDGKEGYISGKMAEVVD